MRINNNNNNKKGTTMSTEEDCSFILYCLLLYDHYSSHAQQWKSKIYVLFKSIKLTIKTYLW